MISTGLLTSTAWSRHRDCSRPRKFASESGTAPSQWWHRCDRLRVIPDSALGFRQHCCEMRRRQNRLTVVGFHCTFLESRTCRQLDVSCEWNLRLWITSRDSCKHMKLTHRKCLMANSLLVLERSACSCSHLEDPRNEFFDLYRQWRESLDHQQHLVAKHKRNVSCCWCLRAAAQCSPKALFVASLSRCSMRRPRCCPVRLRWDTKAQWDDKRRVGFLIREDVWFQRFSSGNASPNTNVVHCLCR